MPSVVGQGGEYNVLQLEDRRLTWFVTHALFRNYRPLRLEADRAEPFFLNSPRPVRPSDLDSPIR